MTGQPERISKGIGAAPVEAGAAPDSAVPIGPVARAKAGPAKPPRRPARKRAVAGRPRPGRQPPEFYLNRELTWLDFNRRVLDEARDPRTPLLERFKFLVIVSSNLDEFFMKRIGGLKQPVGAGVQDLTVDGRYARNKTGRGDKEAGCQQALIDAAERRNFEANRLRKRKPRVISRRTTR